MAEPTQEKQALPGIAERRNRRQAAQWDYLLEQAEGQAVSLVTYLEGQAPKRRTLRPCSKCGPQVGMVLTGIGHVVFSRRAWTKKLLGLHYYGGPSILKFRRPRYKAGWAHRVR